MLELGAGTGWNAALLMWRAGAGRVVSAEVDDELARRAKESHGAVGAGVSGYGLWAW
ncbi:hypothetical protein GCM10010390_91540 [Streptomyces mordarskii]|uniref:Uncharacterized protein n=1 Tax=Streptomyces mordarskii TaxID=1226758 RepID=A0ABN1ETK8_9ACTN